MGIVVVHRRSSIVGDRQAVQDQVCRRELAPSARRRMDHRKAGLVPGAGVSLRTTCYNHAVGI